jgi:malonyl-CoA/methylmalonyl-CoA synthetase
MGREFDRWSHESWQRHVPGLDDDLLATLTAEESLPRSWRARWREAPDAVALVSFESSGDRGHLTRGEIELETARAAQFLSNRGLEQGGLIVISADSSTNLVLLYVAALRLGAIVVPVNTGYRGREMDYIVSDVAPSVAIVDDHDRARRIRSVGQEERPVVVDPSELDGFSERGTNKELTLDAAGPDDIALIFYTSGTTGRPKGAALTHRNLLAASRSLEMAWRWDSNDGLILCVPLFHIHGLGVALNTCLLIGSRIILVRRFEPKAVLRAAARPDATLLFAVPTMWVGLIDAVEKEPSEKQSLSSLRLLVSGSAPLSSAVFDAARACSGKVILERSGMSETVTLISNPYDGERRAGTVGYPLPGVELRVVTSDGERAEAGQTGEIRVRGPNVFSGYWNRPSETADAFDEDGWFRTGDLGTVSLDGYLSIVGRTSELIIVGGYNVYPREVEEVLDAHPDIGDSAVVGSPSRRWGEEVIAFVVLADRGCRPPRSSVNEWCRERLTNYKRPREIVVVEELPRNSMGKTLKGQLRAAVTSRRGDLMR